MQISRSLGPILYLLLMVGHHHIFAKTCDKIVVSGAYTWKPYLSIDEQTKKVGGLSAEILKHIGRTTKRPIEHRTDLPWKRVLLLVEKGEIDMCAAIYKNREREQKYLYSESFASDDIRVFVKKGMSFPFDGLDHLKGKIGGIPIGASFGNEFDLFAKKHLKIVSGQNVSHLFKMLLSDRIDYLVSAHQDVRKRLRQDKIENQIEPLAHSISSNKVYFIMSRQSPCKHLLPDINKTIANLKSNGEIEKLMMEN